VSEAFRIIAARQAEQRARQMVAYVRTHNPSLSEDEAQAIVLVAEIHPHTQRGVSHTAPPGFYTEKAKELARALTDPDALEKFRDSRDQKRQAPIERRYRELKNREHADKVRKELGEDVAPGRTLDEKALDVLRNLRQRRQQPQQDTTADTQPVPTSHVKVVDPPPKVNPLEELAQRLQPPGEGG
jgi:hypothetical protein